MQTGGLVSMQKLLDCRQLMTASWEEWLPTEEDLEKENIMRTFMRVERSPRCGELLGSTNSLPAGDQER